MPERRRDPAGAGAAAALAAIAGLHVAWAAGSPWPCGDRERLAAAVDGVAADAFPGPGPTLAVAALLAAAAGLVSAQSRGGRALAPRARPGAAAAAAVLTLRGVVGLARPGLLPAGDRAPFARLNARLYSPLCLLLGGAIARSLSRPGRR